MKSYRNPFDTLKDLPADTPPASYDPEKKAYLVNEASYQSLTESHKFIVWLKAIIEESQENGISLETLSKLIKNGKYTRFSIAWPNSVYEGVLDWMFKP